MADEEDANIQAPEEENPYTRFAEPQQEEANPYAKFAPQGAEEENPYAKFATSKEEPPSAVGSAVRGVLRGAIPMTAGVLGGAAGAGVGGLAGAGAGSLALPVVGTVTGAGVGAFGGALAGGYAGSELARSAQEKITDTLGIDSPESRAADAGAHPYISQGAELATGLGSLGTAGKLGARVAVGGLMGGVDLLNQGFHKGFSNIDPTEAAIAAGFGAAAPTPQAWTNKITGPVKAGAAKFFGQTPKGEGAPVEATAAPAQPFNDGVTRVDNILSGDPAVQAIKDAQTPAANSASNQQASEYQTPPLTPEETARRRANLEATPAPPMVGKSGIPFAPQANNLRVGEEPPPATDVTSGPGRFSDGDSVATAPDATAPSSAGTEPSPTTFQTAKGSTYQIHEDGTTTRTKAARDQIGHEGDSGLKPRSEKTVYVDPKQAPAFNPPDSAKWRVVDHGDGTLSLATQNADGKWGIAPLSRNIKFETVPREGLSPVELWGKGELNGLDAYNKVHPGNAIVKTQSENFGGRGVDGQNENTRNLGPLLSPTEEALIETSRAQRGAAQNAREKAAQGQEGEAFLPEASEPPRPQSLSAAAPEGGAASTYEIPQGPPRTAKLKNASTWQKLNKMADDAFSLPRWLVAPHTISDAGMAADRINRANMGETFGKQAEFQKQVADATAQQDQYFRNMTPEQRTSAITEVENGVIDKDHPGWHAMDAMRKVSEEQNEDLAKKGATKSYVTGNLASFLPDFQRQKFRQWAQSFKDDNKRWPTLGDALKYEPESGQPGFKLREDLLNADGSPDVGKVYAQMIHAKGQAALRTSIVRDYREGWGKQGGIEKLDPLLHDSPHEGDKPIDLGVTDNIQLYGAPEVKAVLERYLNPTLRDSKIKNSYDAYMSIKNATNAINLVGGVYHMRFMLQESVINEVSRGMARLLNGDMAGFKDIAHAPLSPVTLAKTGKNFVLDALQNPDKIKDPFDKVVVNTLKEAGQLPPGRIRGGGITPELETGALQGLVTAWKPAFQDYMHDMVQAGLKIKNKAGEGDYLGAAKDTGIASIRAFSEGLQTLMHPLFSKYIPLIKAGANFQNMKQFMIDNPGLSHDEYVNMARKFVNSTDNAMGELNQSMLYAPAWLKAVGNGTTLSLGWQIGDVKQFLGGAREFVRNPAAAKFGKDYDPRVMYIPAFLAVTALSNIMYQVLKGQGAPKDLTDVIAPRTGGKTKSGTPERAIQPGYEKDVLEMSNVIGGPESTPKAFMHYMYNKLASLPKTAFDEFVFNQDFAGKQIVNPSDPFATRLHDYMAYAVKHMLQPIVVQQALHEEKNKGTNIDKFEQFLGNRHAPQQWQEPQKYLSRVQKENAKAAKDAKKFHQNTGY